MTTPKRVGSRAVGLSLASSTAWRAAPKPKVVRRLTNLEYFLWGRYGKGSKSFTSAAMDAGKVEASKRVMGPTPLAPLTMPDHVVGQSLPRGVTAPTPGMTTRRGRPSLTLLLLWAVWRPGCPSAPACPPPPDQRLGRY